MPTTDITGRVKSIVGLDDEDCKLLIADGIKTQEDLLYVCFEDFDAMIPVVKRRKLELVKKYLEMDGMNLTSTITIEEIRSVIKISTLDSTASKRKVDYGAPKVYTDPLTEFSGDPIDYEEWEGKSAATLRQTAYRQYLDRDADPDDPNEVARNSELYNMILSAVRSGGGHSRVEKLKDDPNIGENGHFAWKSLKDWYLDPTQKNLMMEHYSSKLDALTLDNDTTATDFINDFDIYLRKIEKFDGAWSDEKKVREFKKRIVSSDYDVEKRTHTSQKGSYEDLVQSIRDREQTLQTEAIQEKVQRRYKTPDEKPDASSADSVDKSSVGGKNSKFSKKDYNIPFIPGFLFRSFDNITKKNVRKWRDMTNAGQTMAMSDMITKKDKDKESGTDDPPAGKKEQHKKKKGKKQRRMTTKVTSGLPDDTVEVKLDTDDEDYIVGGTSINRNHLPCSYDSKINLDLDRSINDVRMIRRNTSVGISRGRTTRQPYAVIDPGATEDLVGGQGWRIVHISNRTETLVGAINGMGSVTLPKADAITAVTDENGKVQLLGFGNVTYDSRITQHESLLNSHHMRSHGCIVNDVAKKHGGTQDIQLKVGNESIHIPLSFDGDIMKLKLREPTDEELTTLGVVWIMPAIVNHTPQSIRRNRPSISTFHIQVPEQGEPVPEEEVAIDPLQTTPASEKKKVTFGNDVGLKNWKELLGFPSDEVVEKTLDNTTQLCAEPVEMERRELPRQHRKKRLHPLHPKRLHGRTDSDTFFSSVKSIRGYKCVQLFVHVPSDFLFVRCMQREKHSHGALQDFIREVGAPTTLITDNSQTQTGEKWKATSRQVMTKQRKFAPHNQNQNKAERRIGDAKHKTMQVMRWANAPLVFWCYALIHVIDCLNHIAKKRLNWRTSYELLNGDTPDLSAFRFTFWQPIEYFDPVAKFPDSQWKKGRFLGIAWDTGDQFTFYVWTDHDGDWKNGSELTRNIVRPRKTTASQQEEKVNEDDIDQSTFKFQKKVATRKRRRGNNQLTKYELKDIDAVDDDNEEEVTVGDNVEATGNVQPSDHPIILGSENDSSDQEKDDGGEETSPEPDITTTTHNQPQSKNSDIDTADSSASEIAMVNEVNNQFSRPDEVPEIGGSTVVCILAHEWRFGQLHFKVEWSDKSTSWESLRDLKEDHPRLTAKYIVDNKVSRSKRGGDRVLQWANKVVRDTNRAIRRITRLYDFYLNEDDTIRKVRRNIRGKKKKKKFSNKPVYKYGILVPRNADHAIEIDEANGNTEWQDSMKKEIDDLESLDCWEMKEAGFNPGKGWQPTTLHMVFDVKHDLRRKSRLVAGGHLVNLIDTPYYSSTVKSISVQLLHVIAHKLNLKQLCGDIGNAFVNAYTNERVYVPEAGSEFGPENKGKCIIIRKALYGLKSSSERFHSHLADSLRTFGFKQTRFDNDVWIRLESETKTYEYICTHVDDFMIVSKNPDRVMKEIESVYLVKDSSKGPPDYYLGNDYKRDKKGRWCIGCKKYLMEAIRRIEEIFGQLPKKDSPMVDGDHPELDTTSPLSDDDHRKYQMLIGMLNWIVCLGRIDVAFSTSSLSRFTACPRKGHLDRVLRVFGYLKKHNNRRYIVDSRDPILVGGTDALEADYTKTLNEFYPDAVEEIDSRLPEPLIDEIAITAFVDSDHAHDQITRRSITGLLVLVGRTPVFFMSKRQGAIETSTYGAEFCAMRTATEEVQSIRYMLRCLGVRVDTATLICGDNKGVIQNSTIPDSLLKKKHVAIAYHKTRESAAAGITHPIKIAGTNNFADLLTKALTGKTFWRLFGKLTRG